MRRDLPPIPPGDGASPAPGGQTLPLDPCPRRQHTGVAAVEHALEEGLPLRLVLVRRGATGPRIEGLRRRLIDAGVELRRTSANDLRRMRVDFAAAPPSDQRRVPAKTLATSPDPWGVLVDAKGRGDGPEVLGFSGPDPRAPMEEWMADHVKPAWLLTGVAYPGNAGYAIRCAEVSGAAGIVFDVSFDRFRRLKALRTSMGAHRFLPVAWERAETAIASARAAGRCILAIEDCGTIEPWECDLTTPVLLVVGGEETGVPREILDQADAVLRLPVRGFVPSYNLQAAMAMVAGESLRQLRERTTATDPGGPAGSFRARRRR